MFSLDSIQSNKGDDGGDVCLILSLTCITTDMQCNFSLPFSMQTVFFFPQCVELLKQGFILQVSMYLFSRFLSLQN